MSKLLDDFNSKDLKIFKEEFRDFIPEKIIDTHVHLFEESSFIKEIREKFKSFPAPGLNKKYKDYKYSDLMYNMEKLFPGKEYNAIIFGTPVDYTIRSKGNEYISNICRDNNNVYGCYMPEVDQENIPSTFFNDGFIGFKVYPYIADKTTNDFSKRDINVTMYSYMSEAVLEFANRHKLMIVNHIHRAKRLNDENNIKEIIDICSRYPDIKMILAHAGRSYTYYDIKDSIEYIKGIENLYFDLSMVNDYRVIELLLKKVGVEKLFYASDLPIAALKGKNVDVNNKHYFITKDLTPWSISSDCMELDSMTYFVYEIVRAIKDASERVSLKKDEVEKIFYRNALDLINDIRRFNNI